MMDNNPQEWQENYGRILDRMPHTGQAIFGPYVDRLARAADRVVFCGCVVAVLFIVLFT